jgi:WXG100 family type VII secretion target
MAVSLAAAQAAAALPGGAPLAGIAAQLNGDSAAISGIADNWKQSANSGQQHTAAVSDAVTQVAADWKGTAQQAFTGLMERFAQASRKVQEPLLVGSKALTNASDTIDAAQKTVEGICERLLSYASNVRALGQANNVKPADINTAISKAAAQAVSECQAAVKQANSALQQVSSTLSSALSSMGVGTVSSLPTPNPTAVPPGSTGSGPSLSGTGGTGGAPVSGGGGSGGSGGSGGGSAGPVPSGVVSGSMVQNAKTIFDYLTQHGYTKVAAAGIVACIYGESTLNPEAQGSGGWGLIGFTPQFPGEYANLVPTGNASADLAKQLPAILQYNDGWSQFKPMLNSATSVQQAADIYSQYFERPAVLFSDVHAQGIAIAQQVSGVK